MENDLMDFNVAVMRALHAINNAGPAIQGHNGDGHTRRLIKALDTEAGVSRHLAYSLLTESGGWNDKCSPPWGYQELSNLINEVYGG